MEILLVLLVGAGVLYYLYKKMNQPESFDSVNLNSGTPSVPPMPEPQPVPEVPTTIGNIQLPEGWNVYTPAEKIAFFNANGITEEQLVAYGTSPDDISWMRANGYTVGLTIVNHKSSADLPEVETVRKTRTKVKKAADLSDSGRVTSKDVKVAASRARKSANVVAEKTAKTATKSVAKPRTKK